MHDSQDSTVTLSADAYFKRSGFRARVRACMLAPHLDELVVWMTARGHPPNSIYTALRNALRLAEFAEEEGVREPALLTDDLVGRLLTGVEGQPRLHKERRLSCRLTMEFLREQAIVPAAAMPPSESGPYLLSEYLRYLVNHRGVGTRHALRHRAHVSKFVQFVLGDDVESVGSLEAAGVFRFVTTYAQELSRAQRKLMCAALRSFLRFLRVRGHLPTDLSSAVPVIPSFKLDRLPPVISAADIEQILAAVDRSTPIGRRDYAMLLLLGTYGMRAGQLCALRLDDIDWRQETIRIRGAKGGEDVILPLRPAVGEAVIDYLRHGRPCVGSWREVFLRVRAPIGPLGGNVCNIIKPYARKAGLRDIPLGAHAWRHGVASRMLAEGQPLKTIRDALGHRSIETTFIYTKVDIEQLREAALEWPEGARP